MDERIPVRAGRNLTLQMTPLDENDFGNVAEYSRLYSGGSGSSPRMRAFVVRHRLAVD
jgi:hypothetical protein